MKHSGIPWIGEIPKDWKTATLLQVLRNRISDGPHETPNLVDNGIPFISVDSLNESEDVDFNIVRKFISENDYKEYSKKTNLEIGDILFTKSATIGKTAIVKDDRFMIWSPIAILKPNHLIQNKFLYHLVSNGYFKDYVCQLSTFNTQFNIGMRTLEKAKICFPSLPEQQKIASFLDRKCSEIDEMIALQEKIVEELKAYKQSVITEAVTKGLNPYVPMKDSGIEWIGEIPENWRVAKLSTLFSFKGGYAFDSSEFGLNGNNQVIRIGNVKNDLLLLDTSPVYISDETAFKAQKSKLDKGQILFTMTGTKGKRDYFYTLLLKDNHFSDKKLYLNQRVGCFVEKDNVCAGYYNYLLKDKHILDVIFLYETGTANQGNLGIESIKNTKVQFPPLSEQQSIASYLDEKCSEIDSLISIKQSKIESLKEYKKSIIYEYVTGKKEVE